MALRRWKPGEVPVGAIVVMPNDIRVMIVGEFEGDVLLPSRAGIAKLPTSYLLDLEPASRWKWPQEPDSALRPCGVEE